MLEGILLNYRGRLDIIRRVFKMEEGDSKGKSVGGVILEDR